jgi:disulfide bond formation protein DsbB
MQAPSFVIRPTERTMLIRAGAVAAVALVFAFTAQYGFGLHPCELCLAQRYPYAAIILLSLAAFLPVPSRVRFALGILCGLLFLADGGIAFYHTGVELKWFPGPTACAGSGSVGQTLEEMRAEIMSAALVPCDQPMAKFLGLSMASWNAIYTFLFAWVTFATARQIRAAK